MRRRGIWSVTIRLILFLMVCMVCGCQMYGTTGGLVKGAGYNGASAAGISISVYSFNPSAVSFPAANMVTVTWTNNDGVTHTVTSNGGVSSFTSSGYINPGMTYSVTFPSAGTYSYHCSIHTTMTGTITVN
jgi:plastocyanin